MQSTRLTRRELVKSAAYLFGAVSSAALLEACTSASPSAAPTAVPTAAPQPAAAATTAPAATGVTAVTPAAEAAGIVAPKAARGELPEGTIVIAISGGPEADAHKRLAAKFTEYTKGKVQVRIEEIPRGTPGNAKALPTLQGQPEAWDVLSVTSDNFTSW